MGRRLPKTSIQEFLLHVRGCLLHIVEKRFYIFFYISVFCCKLLGVNLYNNNEFLGWLIEQVIYMIH